jgi:hypothetical protein
LKFDRQIYIGIPTVVFPLLPCIVVLFCSYSQLRLLYQQQALVLLRHEKQIGIDENCTTQKTELSAVTTVGTSGRATSIWENLFHSFAGSIPDEIIGLSNLPNPSSRNMALGSNQPLTEMSTRNLPGG